MANYINNNNSNNTDKYISKNNKNRFCIRDIQFSNSSLTAILTIVLASLKNAVVGRERERLGGE